MANATPVIATRAIDLPEYLGPSAIYIDGSAGALADAILELDADDERIKTLGRELRERAAREFSYERTAQRISDVYAQALGSNGGDRASR
jgi:glycosyltransferase involved in cell wall biosynthesis